MPNSGDNTHTLQTQMDTKSIPGASNSDLPREAPKLDSLKKSSKAELPKEAPKSDTPKAQPPKPPAVSPSKVAQSRCIPMPQGVLKKYSRMSMSVPPKHHLDYTPSSTNNSQLPFESFEYGSEDTLNKPRQKLSKPRMNRLTVQRIQRLQTAANVPDDIPLSPRFKRQTSKLSARGSMSIASSHGSVAELFPSPNTFEGMLNKLKDLQTEFLQMAAGLQPSKNGIYKLVSVVQNKNCKFVLHKDDLVEFPPSPHELPAELTHNPATADFVNDLKSQCRQAIDSGFTLLFASLTKVQLAEDEAQAEAAAEAIRMELRMQIKSELNAKLTTIEQELNKVCIPENSMQEKLMARQIGELSSSKSHLSNVNSKLENQLRKMKSSMDDLRKLLNESQMENNKLTLDLADKNIEVTEQNGKIDDQKKEIKHLKNVNKVVQQRLKENDESLALQTSECSELKLKEKLVHKEVTDLKKRAKELTNSLAAKETELESLHVKLHELTQKEYCSGTEQAQIKDLQRKLEMQAEVERHLTCLVEQKQSLLNKLEQKLNRLEEQLEQHRQVMLVRGERINTLDNEIKQRDTESHRRIAELMTITNDKNAIITQITNELASTNEQFQNLCTTLSIKQSKLHSQEHVIRLLEESNARSVKLHTKLGEKNAMLKDELEHLRRTVNNLMLGNGARDVEMADIRLG